MTIHGYNTRFYFEFVSQNGTEYTISIKKRGYNGAALKRKLGQAPILRKDNADNGICGTSLELWAETSINEEYAELYTSDAKEYAVTIDTLPALNYDNHLWVGFVTPELYSEPCIAPPYNTQIIATDGLGELKNADFINLGRVPIEDHIKSILTHTGVPLSEQSIRFISSLKCEVPAASAGALLYEIAVDLENLSEKSCYEALSCVMQSLNAKIEQRDGRWQITRESDVRTISGRVRYYNDSSLDSSSPAEIGAAYETEYWIVDKLSKEVVPAKNKTTVEYKHEKAASILPNPFLETNSESWVINNGEYHDGVIELYLQNPNVQAKYAQLSSEIHIEDTEYTLSLKTYYRLTTEREIGIRIMLLDYKNVLWFWDEVDARWKIAAPMIKRISGGDFFVAYNKSKYTINEIKFRPMSVQVSPFGENSDYYDLVGTRGLLIVEVHDLATTYMGQGAPNGEYMDSGRLLIGELRVTNEAGSGVQSVVNINNNARETDSVKSIYFGDLPEVNPHKDSYINYLSKADTPTTGWSTDLIPQGDYLSVLSQDYALLCAMPRIKLKGVLNTPIYSLLPISFLYEGNLYALDTYSWNLLTDELDCILISAPAVNIGILTNTIEEIPEGGYQGGSGSSSRGSSGGGFSGNFEKLTNKPTINEIEVSGIKTNADYHLAHINGSQEEDFNAKALTLHYIQEQEEGEPIDEENNKTVDIVVEDSGALSLGNNIKIGDIYIFFDAQNMALKVFSRTNGEDTAANIFALGELVSGAAVEEQPGGEGDGQPPIQGGTNVQWGNVLDNFAELIVGEIAKNVALQGHTHSRLSSGKGSSIIPIYLDTNGQPQECERAYMIVGAAARLNDGTYNLSVGNNNAPVYFSNGVPVATTNTFATQSWVSNQGFLTSLPSHNHDGTYLKTITWSDISSFGGTTSTKFALGNHTHSGYAASGHNHDTEYATKSHSHTEYAASSHSHSEYAASGHDHNTAYHPKNGATDQEMKANKLTLYYSSYNGFINVVRESGETRFNFTTHLKVNGNIYTTGEVTGGVASDRRLKANIRELREKDSIDVLSKLRPVSFVWNEKARKMNPDRFGIARSFIADEFLKVLPNAGRQLYEDYDAIYIEQVIPYLVKGWQSQQKKIDEQQKRIEDLEKKLERLMKIIENYEQQ